jgi:putative membrane protein
MKNPARRAGAEWLVLGRGLALALILPATLASVAPGTIPAANAQSVGSCQTGGPSSGSAAFVRDTGNAGQFEVKSGRLALERSEHVAVRDYATQAVKDAEEMINRVKFINNAATAARPSELSIREQGTLNRLGRLSGADFDREYMRAQIEVGELQKKTFSDYGANGDSAALRVYAAKAATGYDAQLVQARAIAGSL